MLACLILIARTDSQALAQASGASGKCEQPPILYALAHYKVEHVTVKPMVKFVTSAALLNEALTDAIAVNVPGSKGVWASRVFDTVWVSQLEFDLNDQLERRILRGTMGLIFAHHQLINCDETARTMEVEYEVLTVARPSYLKASFEAGDRKNKTEEATGTFEKQQTKRSFVPFAGYNRSRGIFGGSDFVLESDYGPLNKLAVSASGSSSSAVVDASLAGSKNFAHGPLGYAEWQAAYGYSNIPTDGFDLKEATGAVRVFAATRPATSRNLIFRVGASVEGGNRQSDFPQSAATPDTLVDSGYGTLKLYGGASLSTRRQDFKASYGLQLGNTGEDFDLDYRKQIFDSAYRLRFLPKPFKPFQLDVQFTAGSLTTLSGPVPYGERFFGGNVEEEFIQNDSWKIRSNPVIRSFPQNRLNGGDGSLPVGGDNFLSVNFTAAQTIWQKQLIPSEISEDPDMTMAMGTQLLTARVIFREEAVRASKEIKALEGQTICTDQNRDRHCLTPIIDRLSTLLDELKTQAGSDDGLKAAIKVFTDNDGSDSIGDVKGSISEAKFDPEADKKVIENANEAQVNPVETNVNNLIKDQGDDFPAQITIVQSHITDLQKLLAAPAFAKSKEKLDSISTDMIESRKALQAGLEAVNALRAYKQSDVQGAKDALEQPAGSGRKLDEVLGDISSRLKPESANAQAQIQQLNVQLSQMTDTDPQTPEVKKRRAGLIEYKDQLDAAVTFAENGKSSYGRVDESFAGRDFEGVKIFLEKLTVGFGGLLSQLEGVQIKVKELKQLVREQGLRPLPAELDTDIADVRFVQPRVRSAFNKIRIPPAEVTANKTVSYVSRILGVFFRETNIVAVSPVFMFDAARLRVNDRPDTDRFRYGVGSGMRFSLINIDFTAGYSLNPNRHLHDPRGAFVFRMDINDLFK